MYNNNKMNGKQSEKVNALLTFLARTKNGEYAPIDESSLIYTRIKEETDFIEPAEEYYYSFS